MYRGTTGSTVTGGTELAARILKAQEQRDFELKFVLSPGSSLACTVQPPAGNTSQNYALTLVFGYLEEDGGA
jgi:hypothetical protein